MNDINISASLDAAKFTAHKHPDKPGTMIRRIEFKLVCPDFSVEHAEWLGEEAIDLRKKLQSRTLSSFTLLLGAYHAKLKLSGIHGNAETTVDGIKAVAAVKGKDEDEHEELDLVFEAPVSDRLATFVGASLKETVGCDFAATQLELGSGVRQAVDKLAASIPKGTSMTFSTNGESGVTLEGTGEPRNAE